MQRYFISADQFYERFVNITGDDAHHIQTVMRAQIGDKVICSDGISREVIVKITELAKGKITAEIWERLEMNHESVTSIWIAQSLPKADKMEMIIQKCTELGAVAMIPFVSERTVVHYDAKKEAKRIDRWCKIAKEAAEQAHRNRIPDIQKPLTWKEMLQLSSTFPLSLICYEKETTLAFKALLQKNSPLSKVFIIVGPEGGFTPKEIEEAEGAGCFSISLGRRILRTETAAMTALACILYESGEMGG